MKGGQAALEIGFFAAFVAITIGALVGAVAGLAGGIVDSALMRVVDVFLSVPFLFVVLILAVRYGASVLSLSLVIGGFSWPVPARLVRGEVLTIRERDFVAGRADGGCRQLAADRQAPAAERVRRDDRQRDVPGGRRHPGRRLRRFPRLRAALPQPGLGRHDLRRRRVTSQDGYWWLIYPVGVCIVLTVMALNFIGDALRDSLDVRLRQPLAAASVG